MGADERYSRTPLPAYRYVPGRTPHPGRGHAPGVAWPVGDLDVEHWAECEPHLHAVDLFNAGYYWEAHEAWEGLWRRAGRRTETGRFLQGLIQLSAGLLKYEMGAAGPSRGLIGRGLEKLRAPSPSTLGIDVAGLAGAVAGRVAGSSARPRLRLAMPAGRP